MEVKDKMMYHFHHSDLYPEIWVPGNEITVDNNFNSLYGTIIDTYGTSVKCYDGKYVPFNKVINYYLHEEQDNETYIELLKQARDIIRGSNLFLREQALEIVRSMNYPELPSRKHSIWLCDEKSKRHWEDTLDECDDLELFKVSVTGNLFKSSDSFLPDDGITFGKMISLAKMYWEPKFEKDSHETQAEYLFQGKLKILERIKRTN